ncbi:MAG: ABC transporter ATP-binding protein [Gaiellales bacterium]
MKANVAIEEPGRVARATEGHEPGPEPRPVAVSLRGATKHFGRRVAVDHLDLDIHEGEFFALLGPSGCGKTTTLKLIGGFEQPSSGDIVVHGESVIDLPPFKRNVNTVFQSYALFPHLDVRDNVAFSLRMKRVPKRDRRVTAERALRRVGLEGYGGRRVHQLSGGEQQRVALARALINEPAVLLLDEPLGALDLQLRKTMQAELKAIQHQVGITFVYVTHDQEEALTMADRIAVMSNGELLQVGTPSEIYEHPTSRFVARFIGESSFLEGTLAAGRGDGFVEVALRTGERLIGRGKVDTARNLNGPVTVVVRPEKVVLEPAAVGRAPELGANVLQGTVAETVYVGSDVRYFVDTPAGRVAARVPNDAANSAERTFGLGAHVCARFPREGTVVVEGESGSLGSTERREVPRPS